MSERLHSEIMNYDISVLGIDAIITVTTSLTFQPLHASENTKDIFARFGAGFIVLKDELEVCESA